MSARNRLRGSIGSITPGAVNVGIGIAAVPRVLLTAIIARLLVVGCWLSVAGLGLQVRQEADVVIEA